MIERIATKLLPPVWVLLAMASQVLLDVGYPIREFHSAALLGGGIILMLLGISLTMTAANSFRKAQTPIKPFTESTTIVRTGLFRYTRNPMYLGMLLMLLGSAASLQSLTPFAVVPIFFLIIDRGYILKEEAFLLERFGDEYRTLQSSAPRWIGRASKATLGVRGSQD